MEKTELLIDSARRLLHVVDMQRRVVDRNLSRPAAWRGQLRREISGRAADDAERQRYADAFNWLGTYAARGGAVDESLLRELHWRLLEQSDYRTGSIRIGNRPVGHPPAEQVPDMVRQALARAGDGAEPAPLAAARLHLELALIHPFHDGNGRAARLLASFVLMRAGYRSTLLTAVEQHTCFDPTSYRRSFSQLRATGDASATWTWLVQALSAMALSSQLAAWHRLERSRRAGRSLRLPADTSGRDALAYQLRRLRAEERDDARGG